MTKDDLRNATRLTDFCGTDAIPAAEKTMNVEVRKTETTELRKAPRPATLSAGLELLEHFAEDSKRVDEALQRPRAVGVEHHVVEPHQPARRLGQRGGADHLGVGDHQFGAPAGQVDAVQPVVFRGQHQGGWILLVGVADHRAAMVHARVVEAQRLPPVGGDGGDRSLQGARGAGGTMQRVRHHPRALPGVVGQLLAAPGVDPVQHAALLQVECAGLGEALERSALDVHQSHPCPVRGRGRAAVKVALQRQVVAPAAIPHVDAVVAEEVVRRTLGKTTRLYAHGRTVYRGSRGERTGRRGRAP